MFLETYLRRKTMMLYYWINEEVENSPTISLSKYLLLLFILSRTELYYYSLTLNF